MAAYLRKGYGGPIGLGVRLWRFESQALKLGFEIVVESKGSKEALGRLINGEARSDQGVAR